MRRLGDAPVYPFPANDVFGLTIRQHYAGLMLAALVASEGSGRRAGSVGDSRNPAGIALRLADDLIAELEKTS